MKPIHWALTHLGVLLVGALVVVAWAGWHRPVVTQWLKPQVVNVPTGGQRDVSTVIVPGVTVPQTVTAPTPTIRIITSPATPVVLNPQQQQAAEQAANIVVKYDITYDCVHPDVQQAPDPTCGKPVDGHMLLVQDGAGFVRIANPGQPIVTGPIITQVKLPALSKPMLWEFRASAGMSSAFLQPNVEGELDYRMNGGPLYVGVRYEHLLSPVTVNGRQVNDDWQLRGGFDIRF